MDLFSITSRLDIGISIEPISRYSVGFYFGNDIFDAYNIVYTKDYWRHLRSRAFVVEAEPLVQISKPGTPGTPRGRKFLGGIRNWLAENSILHRTSGIFLRQCVPVSGSEI